MLEKKYTSFVVLIVLMEFVLINHQHIVTLVSVLFVQRNKIHKIFKFVRAGVEGRRKPFRSKNAKRRAKE